MTEPYCTIHNTKFFLTRKGTWAHPIGNGKWCNEPQKPDQMLPEHEVIITKARDAVRGVPSKKPPFRDEDRTDARTAVMTIAQYYGDDHKLTQLAKAWMRSVLSSVEVETQAKEPGKEPDEDVVFETEKGADLSLARVKRLLLKRNQSLMEWIADIAKLHGITTEGKTTRQIWESLMEEEKRVAIGGIK